MQDESEKRQFVATRRALIQGTVAALATLPFVGVLGVFGAAHGEEPKKGGVLRMNMNGDPPSFDLMGNTTSWLATSVGPCYNGLLQVDPLDPEGIIGDLAERWEVSDDGTEYTFYLLKGVKFHDGVPFTAEDVKFTFDVMTRPPEGYVSNRQAELSMVEAIEVIDDHTVKFLLNAPSPSFLTQMATGWMLVQPKHILEKGPMTETVIGTGPFKFGEYVRGVSLSLVRNEDYHVPDRPYLDGINIFIIPDAGSVLGYFKSGQLDCYEYMPNDIARQVMQMGDAVKIQTAPSTGFLSIDYNTTRTPWDDIRVRQAASISIDRVAAKDIMFRGDAVLSGFAFPGTWALPAEELNAIPGYEQVRPGDAIERAKALLADAGYADGFDTKILTRRIARFEPFGVFLKDQWAKLGIRAEVDLQETAAFNEIRARRDFDVNAGGGGIPINDPTATFAPMTCDSEQNQTQLCDAAIDELFAKQAIEMDMDRRRELTNEIERRVLNNYAAYHMFFTIRFQAAHPRVHDYLLHSNPDNNKRMQDVWLSQA